MKKFIFGSIVALAPVLALALGGTGSGGGLADMLGIVRDLINTLLPVVIALALLYFFWGLAKFILAAGDEAARSEARSIMIWGVIALFVMVSVWGLVNVLVQTFNLDTSETPIPEAPSPR